MQKIWAEIESLLRPHAERFEACLKAPVATQKKLFEKLITDNADTTFSQELGFDKILGYEDIEPYIKRIAEGEQNVLTGEPVKVFEKTGGSTGGPKLIPYTASAIKRFQKGVFPWLYDLLQQRPGIKQGRIYFAISPAVRHETRTSGGVSIGAGNDMLYLGSEIGSLFQQLLVVPEIADDFEEWKDLTASALLEARDLSFISVWSPTFLLTILEHIKTRYGNIDTQKVWPQLDTISCWTSAGSKHFAERLQAAFPHVHIQGKGLLLTEGCITIPYKDFEHPILSLESNYYEFLDNNGQVHTIEGLEDGRDYQVIISNDSGLYHYNTEDVVRVHMADNTPQLEFLGRAGIVSDLCGEKLTEAFVTNALSCFLSQYGHFTLTPNTSPFPHYVAVIEQIDIPANLPDQIDQALRHNPQYDYARNLGQLGNVVCESRSENLERSISEKPSILKIV